MEGSEDSLQESSWLSRALAGVENFKVPVILGLGSLFFIALSVALFLGSSRRSEPIQFFDASGSGQVGGVSEASVTVDVEGAVRQPGVYTIPSGKRIGDAIAAAGGLSEEADTDKIGQSVNLAAKLLDGAKLYIPKKGDSSPVSRPGSPGSGNTSALGISINTATASELDSLPGVGPATAKKIIDNRPYQTLEELVRKKVISQSLFEKLKDKLTL